MQTQQLLNKAMLLLQQQKLGPATAIVKKLLKQDPQNFNSLHLYGILLLKQDRLDEARTQLQQAVTQPATAKHRAQAWNNLSLVLHQQRDFTAAEQAINQAIKLYPQDPSFFCNRANLAELRCDWPAAALAFRQALALDPASASARLGYAIALRQQDDYSAAQQQLRQFGEAERDLAWLQEWSLLRCQQQQQDQLQQELQSLQADADLVRDLADYIAEETQPALAEHLYHTCLQLRPDDPVASYMLAAIKGQAAARAPQAYVSQLYDQHAGEFEHRLVDRLGYDAPTRAATLLQQDSCSAPCDVLDLGCGTGLMGLALSLRFSLNNLQGIDLSREMLDLAEAKGCYTALACSDVLSWQTDTRFDLICAMDLLIYLGDLQPIMQRVKTWLKPEGRFICTLEQSDGASPRLTSSGRFQHSLVYMQQLASECDLVIHEASEFPLRREGQQTLTGLMLILANGNT